jgi:uncharacterized alkaline shock family protein YloU
MIKINHGDNMTEDSRLPGQTTVAPEVLIDIIRLSALRVEGVSHLSDSAGEINRLFSKSVGAGVYIVLEDDVVNTTIYLVVKEGYEVLQVAHAVQAKVGRAISEMVGMQVGNIDVHIEDINCAFPKLGK